MRLPKYYSAGCLWRRQLTQSKHMQQQFPAFPNTWRGGSFFLCYYRWGFWVLLSTILWTFTWINVTWGRRFLWISKGRKQLLCCSYQCIPRKFLGWLIQLLKQPGNLDKQSDMCGLPVGNQLGVCRRVKIQNPAWPVSWLLHTCFPTGIAGSIKWMLTFPTQDLSVNRRVELAQAMYHCVCDVPSLLEHVLFRNSFETMHILSIFRESRHEEFIVKWIVEQVLLILKYGSRYAELCEE